MGIMLFLGNSYYAWQAIRMKKNNGGRDFTAQPYGLNTVGGFPFAFGIALSVYLAANPDECLDMAANSTAAETLCENAKFELAWEVTVASNFLTGLLNILAGIAGEHIVRVAPTAAMIVPLAGIGFTWLALNQIAPNFSTPAVGFLPMFLIFVTYYAKSRINLFGWRVPEALHVVFFGMVVGWIYGLNNGDAVSNAADAMQTPGLWAGGAAFTGFSEMGPYLGTIIPISVAASFEDMMCLVSAQKAGDPFPIRETMIVDGIFTCIGAILGSPFGTVIYIGHPVHKANGAKTGYSFINGVVYLILCLSGIFPIIVSLFNKCTTGPIIFIFGLMICEECTKHIPERHHCAIFFGLFFSICDWAGTATGSLGSEGGTDTGPNEYYGLAAMKKGFALCSMVWVCIVVYTVDRRWVEAGAWALVAAVFSLFQIIHADSINFDNFVDGTNMGGTLGTDSTKPNWNSSPLQYMIGYLAIAAWCGVCHMLQKSSPDNYPQPIVPKEGEEDDVSGLVAKWNEPIAKSWEETGGDINRLERAGEAAAEGTDAKVSAEAPEPAAEPEASA